MDGNWRVADRSNFPPPAPLEISGHNSRVAALPKRWDRLRARLDLILAQRGTDIADLPGGAGGLLARDCRGKEADRLVTRIDPGGVSSVNERGHERQAAEELGQWKTHHEERKVIDSSAAAITLALLLTGEELDSLEKSGPLEAEKSRGAEDQVDQMSQTINRRWPSAWPPPRSSVGTGASEMADLPGGASGLLVPGLQGEGSRSDW